MKAYPRTLQMRIIALLSATLIVVVAVIGAITVTTQNGLLLRRVDEHLGVSMSGMRGPGGADFQPLGGPKGGGPGRPRLGSLDVISLQGTTLQGQVVTEDGQTQTLNQETVASLLEAVEKESDGTFINVNLSGIGSYRILGEKLLTDQGQAQVIVGQSLAEVHSTTRNLILIFALAALAGVVGGSIGVAFLVRRTFQPVQELREVSAQVSNLPLSSGEVSFPRVPLADFDRAGLEVQELATSFDAMLGHVEGALVQREQTEARLKQFAADASHELRTPLASISGYAQFAVREKAGLSADMNRSLERILSESGRMGTIVEDLLLLARLDSGVSAPDGDTLVAPVILESLSDAKVASPDHSWTARIDSDAAGLRARIDPGALRQALGNLLTNARVHTPAGTSVSVTLAQADRDSLVIRVEDDGPGVPQDLGERVFDRFVRADTARTGLGTDSQVARSTGLGLSITDELVRASGGSVTVDSIPGRTVFSIWLPRADIETASGEE